MMQVRARRVVDDAGFEALYRSELVSMTALGTSLTGSREAGADLAHEALLRAFRAWPEVSVLDRPGAWVRRVLINLATDRHRRREREQRALVRLQPSTAVRPSGSVDIDSSSAFWSAVRTLPERQRAAVALRYLDDLSVSAIAHILEVSEGTIKASLFAARKRLAVTLGAEEVHDGHD